MERIGGDKKIYPGTDMVLLISCHPYLLLKLHHHLLLSLPSHVDGLQCKNHPPLEEESEEGEVQKLKEEKEDKRGNMR